MSTNANNATTTTTTTGTQPSRGSSIGAGLGGAVKGAFETVQGIGNNIRGNALDFVDSATGTDRNGGHPEADLGRRQAEQGVQRIEAGKHGAANPSDPLAAESATTARGAQAPLPPRSLNGTMDGNGGTVGNDGMGGQIRSNV
ncbi:hypothetical protein C8Q80DRAFT_1319513 [Daedaleopsis nitida]|nr:hypothetical protein C8Q80DRAFT_1319513 [Daedaleopsis nitida]